jgi:hypothetical protein
MADHILLGLHIKPWHLYSEILISSQAHRTPMLLFEFEAELFQFEQREPEFEPLFQLPPRMTASLPISTFALSYP